MKIITSMFLVGALGGVASANGFLLNEFDARAVGRGNATTATETDASAIYYNIGGLAMSPGTDIVLGGSLIAPSASFTPEGSSTKTNSNTPAQVVPGVFGSAHVTDMVAVGLGFYTPFGLAVTWPDGAPQNSVAQDITLHTFFFTPSVALDLSSMVPGLGVGAGIDLVPASIELKQVIPVGTDGTGCGGAAPSCAHLAGTAFGVGGRIGAMYRPASAPRLSLGAMWRSQVTEKFDGNATFDAPDPYRQMLPADGDTKTTLVLPQTFSGGIAYKLLDAFELEGDVVWTQWSKVKELDITVPAPIASGPGTMTIVSPQNYKNTTSLRVGAEYTLVDLAAAIRAGFIYDPTPVPTSTLTAQLPDIDRLDISVGASKGFGNIAVHAGVLVVLPSKRTTGSAPYMPDYKGTFDVSAFVASLSVSGRLGGK